MSAVPQVSWYNREHRLLAIGEQPVSVPKRMAAIMDALIANYGRPLTANRLIELVWGCDEEPDTAYKSLQVQIYRLRHVVGVPIQSGYGHGSNGTGYWLGDPAPEWQAGDRYSNGKGPGTWHVEQVFREAVVVLYNAKMDIREYIPISSSRLKALKRCEA